MCVDDLFKAPAKILRLKILRLDKDFPFHYNQVLSNVIAVENHSFLSEILYNLSSAVNRLLRVVCINCM